MTSIAELGADDDWRRLLKAARRKLESSGGEVAGAVGLSNPTDAERRVVIGITGQHRASAVKTLRVDLADIDAAIFDSFGIGLVAALARIDGPIRDRQAERASLQQERSRALAEVRRRCSRHREQAWFSRWLEEIEHDGTLTRLVNRGDGDLPGWAAEVLQRLPAEGLPAPALAEWATGDTKSLSGTPLATLVLRALAVRAGVPAPADRGAARALWDGVGVVVDDLASQVLVLNLRPAGDHVVADWLRDAADFGIPFRLTLHQLRADPLTVETETIYVCENPAVLRAAAGELSERCAPLICTEGQPSAACRCLLEGARADILWRGDFDWTGLRATQSAIERYRATPWRMTAAEYTESLEAGDSEPLKGAPAPSPWDPALAELMALRGRAVMEERLIPVLLGDLG